MEEIRILSPTGVCGSGFLEEFLGKALACPYNPAHLDRGAVYRFNVNHVVEPDDPCEMFPIRDHALAIKASIPRPCFQGDLRDSDGHGGQQCAPLMDTEIP